MSGDRVVLYTDGITEAVDPSGELFGEDRLHAAIRAVPHDLSARQTADRIFETLQAFQAGEGRRGMTSPSWCSRCWIPIPRDSEGRARAGRERRVSRAQRSSRNPARADHPPRCDARTQ